MLSAQMMISMRLYEPSGHFPNCLNNSINKNSRGFFVAFVARTIFVTKNPPLSVGLRLDGGGAGNWTRVRKGICARRPHASPSADLIPPCLRAPTVTEPVRLIGFVSLRTEDPTKPARNFTASGMHVLPHHRLLRCLYLGCESVIIAISGCHNSLRSVVANPCMHLTFISLRRSQVTPTSTILSSSQAVAWVHHHR